jgi:hypothetical protein
MAALTPQRIDNDLSGGTLPLKPPKIRRQFTLGFSLGKYKESLASVCEFANENREESLGQRNTTSTRAAHPTLAAT